MSVWVWAYANHNIDFSSFANDENTLVTSILDRLDNANLSSDNRICELAKCSEGEKWKCSWIEKECESWPKAISVILGSEIEFEIARNFVFMSANAFPYFRWFDPFDDRQKSEIELWRIIFKTFVKALGGDTIEYFPDNMVEPYDLQPSNIDNYYDLDFNKHMAIIKEEWNNIYNSYDEAVRDWRDMQSCPIVIEHI